MAPRLRVLGETVRPLERIQRAGLLVGGFSKTTAYRVAARDHWPIVGAPGSRLVLMIPLLEMYGIPFEIEGDVA